MEKREHWRQWELRKTKSCEECESREKHDILKKVI